MSRSRDPGSCLDLLLDTMCNAFGGIIFIAISLTVMLTLLKNAASSAAVPEPLNADALRKELEAVEAESRDLLAEIRLAASDPRRKLAAEVTALETESRNRELRLAVRRAVREELRRKEAGLSADVAQRRQELQELQRRNHAAERELAILEQTLQSLRRTAGTAGAEPLRLARLQPSRKEPCFYVVMQNRLWVVGPERDASGSLTLNAACVDFARTGNYFVCTLKNGAETPLASAADPKKIAPEVLNRIRSRKDQVPFFQVAPDSAELFFALHHQLSRERIRHTWRPDPSPAKFTIKVSENAIYEY